MTASRAQQLRQLPRAALLLTLLSHAPARAVDGDVSLTEPVLAGGGMLFAGMLAAILAVLRSRSRVASENKALHRDVATLEARLQSRSEFFATTSHEVRTPLNGILGMTQVLLSDGRLDGWLRERIGVIHGAGETMKVLLDDVLDFARLESGNLTIERVPVELARLIEDAARLWRSQAEAKGLSLDLDLAGCPALIEGDPTRLRQILFNLMANALKFTEAGRVGLSAAAEQGPRSEWLVIRIRDTGIGIAEEQQELVFDKFRQADLSIVRRFGGTGLGLAICRSLAEAMGGTVTLASQVGEGSTFTVTLPLHRLASAPSAVTPSAVPRTVDRLADARILVVEPNALTRRVLCNMIEGFTGAIEVAATSGEAIERLGRGGIDHVVADGACAAGSDEVTLAALLSLAAAATARVARMTVLFAPTMANAASALTEVYPAVQAIAKPIAAAALLGELQRLYIVPTRSEEGGGSSTAPAPER